MAAYAPIIMKKLAQLASFQSTPVPKGRTCRDIVSKTLHGFHQYLHQPLAVASEDALHCVAAVISEAREVGYVPNQNSVSMELSWALCFDSKGGIIDTKAFLDWAKKPAGPVLYRSTGAAERGQHVRSAEGMEVVDAYNFKLKARLMADDATPEHIFLDETVITADIARPRTVYGPASDCICVDTLVGRAHLQGVPLLRSKEIWAARRTPVGSESDPPTPGWYYVANLLRSDPYEALRLLYPGATGRLSLAHADFDLDGMVLAAERRITELMDSGLVEQAINYLIHDALDFRTLGVALGLYLDNDYPGAQQETIAKKVQRLGGRPISVQSPQQRLLQSLHQALCTASSDSALTGATGEVVDQRLAEFAQQLSAIDYDTDCAQEMTNDPNVFCSAKAAIASSRSEVEHVLEAANIVAGIDLLDNPTVTVRSILSVDGSDKGSLNMEVISAYSEISRMQARALAASFTMDNWDFRGIREVCGGGAAGIDQVEAARASGAAAGPLVGAFTGITPLIRDIWREPQRRGNHIVALETDSRKFTPHAPLLMFTAGTYSALGGQLDSDESVGFRLSLICNVAVNKTLMLCNDKMGEGARNPAHGPDCKCYDSALVDTIHEPSARRRWGVPDGCTWSFGAGAVGQGFNGQCSTIYMLAGHSGLYPRMRIIVNGDDQAARRICPVPVEATGGPDTVDSRIRALCHIGNLVAANSTRSFAMARCGTAPSAKKSVIALAVGENPAHSVVYNILTFSGSVLKTAGPGQANALGEITEAGLPAFISHVHRSVVVTGRAEGWSEAQIADQLRTVIETVPGLRETFSAHKLKVETDASYAEISRINRSRVPGGAGDVRSIWSGSMTLISPYGPDGRPLKTIDRVARARAEVEADTAYAPDWARAAAAAGKLYLPAGHPISTLRVSDELGAAFQERQQSHKWLRYLSEFRAPSRTESVVAWMAQGLHLHDPKVDWESYEGGPYIDTTLSGDIARLKEIVLKVGDPHPTAPSGREPALRIAQWPGRTDYREPATAPASEMEVVNSEVRGSLMLLSVIDRPTRQAISDDLRARVTVPTPHDTPKTWVYQVGRREVVFGPESQPRESTIAWEIKGDAIVLDVPRGIDEGAALRIGQTIATRLGKTRAATRPLAGHSKVPQEVGALVSLTEEAFSGKTIIGWLLKPERHQVSIAAWARTPARSYMLNRTTLRSLWTNRAVPTEVPYMYVTMRDSHTLVDDSASWRSFNTGTLHAATGTTSSLASVFSECGGWVETTGDAIRALHSMTADEQFGMLCANLGATNPRRDWLLELTQQEGLPTEIAPSSDAIKAVRGIKATHIVGACIILRAGPAVFPALKGQGK